MEVAFGRSDHPLLTELERWHGGERRCKGWFLHDASFLGGLLEVGAVSVLVAEMAIFALVDTRRRVDHGAYWKASDMATTKHRDHRIVLLLGRVVADEAQDREGSVPLRSRDLTIGGRIPKDRLVRDGGASVPSLLEQRIFIQRGTVSSIHDGVVWAPIGVTSFLGILHGWSEDRRQRSTRASRFEHLISDTRPTEPHRREVTCHRVHRSLLTMTSPGGSSAVRTVQSIVVSQRAEAARGIVTDMVATIPGEAAVVKRDGRSEGADRHPGLSAAMVHPCGWVRYSGGAEVEARRIGVGSLTRGEVVHEGECIVDSTGHTKRKILWGGTLLKTRKPIIKGVRYSIIQNVANRRDRGNAERRLVLRMEHTATRVGAERSRVCSRWVKIGPVVVELEPTADLLKRVETSETDDGRPGWGSEEGVAGELARHAMDTGVGVDARTGDEKSIERRCFLSLLVDRIQDRRILFCERNRRRWGVAWRRNDVRKGKSRLSALLINIHIILLDRRLRRSASEPEALVQLSIPGTPSLVLERWTQYWILKLMLLLEILRVNPWYRRYVLLLVSGTVDELEEALFTLHLEPVPQVNLGRRLESVLQLLNERAAVGYTGLVEAFDFSSEVEGLLRVICIRGGRQRGHSILLKGGEHDSG
jgi:hypothetical protein